MNLDALVDSVTRDSEPPGTLTPALQAMWLAKKGCWDAAHDLCQDVPGTAGSWIHAWLHRQEGDYGNACYWYSRAGKSAPTADASLDVEWREIAEALLAGA